MALRFSRCQYPGICNSCPKTAKYYVQAGIHRLLLCYDCTKELQGLIKTGTECKDIKVVEYDHMKEVSHDQ